MVYRILVARMFRQSNTCLSDLTWWCSSLSLAFGFLKDIIYVSFFSLSILFFLLLRLLCEALAGDLAGN